MDESLWKEVNVCLCDSFSALKKKVEEAFADIIPSFVRKVKFLEQKVTQGKRAMELALRNDEEAELANLENIKSEELKLLEFCHGLTDQVLKRKISKMETRG